jgi:hypothetical protein
MHPVVSQLDLDGDFLLFADTSTIEKSIMASIDDTAEMITGSDKLDPEELAEVTAIVAKIKDAIAWCGLLSLDSCAVSIKTMDNNLSRIISINEFSKEDGQKALWRILASDPTVLKGIQYAPANAVYTVNSTASLNELWMVANEALKKYFPTETATKVAQQIAMVEMMLSTSLNDLIGSLDNEILVSIQLSETKQSTFPGGVGPMVIPEPSLIIGLQTKDPKVSQLILTKLKEASAPMLESTHGSYTLNTLNLPIPMPCPVAPTLVQTEDYLLIGSSLEAITNALDCQISQNGLMATPLYKKLLADAPEKTSGIEFVSPRFMQTYIAVMKQMVGESGGAETTQLLDAMLGGYNDLCSGGYTLKTPDGIYSEGYADYGGVKPVEMLVSIYVKAITSAVAIPLMSTSTMSNNRNRAMTSYGRIGCAMIEVNLKLHWAKHGNFDGVNNPTDLAGIESEDLYSMCTNDYCYSFGSLIDGQNYTIIAQGIGEILGTNLIMTVKDGGVPSWDISTDNK